MIHLQPKIGADRAKASMLNAALAEVPKPLASDTRRVSELAQSGDTVKAIDNLKAAVSLYPKFPLALNELGVQYLEAGTCRQGSRGSENCLQNLLPMLSHPGSIWESHCWKQSVLQIQKRSCARL